MIPAEVVQLVTDEVIAAGAYQNGNPLLNSFLKSSDNTEQHDSIALSAYILSFDCQQQLLYATVRQWNKFQHHIACLTTPTSQHQNTVLIV